MATSLIQRSLHFGEIVDITSQETSSNGFTAPTDGIIQVYAQLGNTAEVGYDEHSINSSGPRGIRIHGSLKGKYITGCAPIRQGEVAKYIGAGNIVSRTVLFIPLIT